MQNREKLISGHRIINTTGFNLKLVRNKNACWTFKEDLLEQIPPFIQCLNVITTGKPETPKEIELLFKKDFFCDLPRIPLIHQQAIADIYNVIIDFYAEYPIPGGRDLFYSYSLGGGSENPKKVALLISSKENNVFLLLFPNRWKKLDLVIKWRYCNTCGDWRTKSDWVDHLKRCRKCGKCGKQYYSNSGHDLLCGNPHYKKSKRAPMEEAKMYELEPEELKQVPFDNIYLADLEAFVPPGERDYVCYAAAYGACNDPSDKVCLFTGKQSLDDFMRHIIRFASGVMWFFNGTRFDNFFLFRWIIENKIKFRRENLLISGNNILSLSFRTKNGWIQLKDLQKFLTIGTLAYNCKSFGLAKEQSKKEFDHLKMKTWEDVNFNHKEEYSAYLKMDVISLKNLYILYADKMFAIYHLNIAKYMTSAQFAYGAWSAGMSKKGYTFFKTPVEDESIMREMYKGGRVFCGRKKWKSNSWKKIMESLEDSFTIPKRTEDFNPDDFSLLDFMDGMKITKELYDEIDDYLVYADVNSLYPAAQVNCKYPFGRNERRVLEGDDEAQLLKELNERHETSKEKFWRMGLCVDVTCPNDLTVAFLMTRAKGGGAVQDLLPKVKIWYTGPELWEATILGYEITRIYEVVEWEDSEEIFNDFVKPTYKIKRDTKNPAERASTKTTLNGLTGKYGQKNIVKKVHVFSPKEEVKEDIHHITEIISHGQVLAYYGFEEKNYTHSPFPIELSAFILSHARIMMSFFLRMMEIHKKYNGHYDETLFYQDTDSLIVHIKSWNRLPEKYKGDKELGQLKLEIDGKIICIIVLANKSYAITYICAKTFKILTITKCKGIPHKGGDGANHEYNTTEFYTCSKEEEEKAIYQSGFLSLRRQHVYSNKVFTPKSENITNRAYIFRELQENENKGKVLYVCYKIPPLFLGKVLARKWSLECIFGGMVRNLKPGSIHEIYIAPETKSRTFCLTDWWGKETRKYSTKPEEVAKKYPTAYPIGHKMLD